MSARLQATARYIPDTVLHGLNGSVVVDLGDVKEWLNQNSPWLSPDQAMDLAKSIMHMASLAYRQDESE